MSASEAAAPTRKPRSKPRRTRGKPNHIDIHVGARVRQRRTLLGMSQEKLADALGLTFQQVQKYERGANRIGAGRLYELSRALDVPVSYFFEEIGGSDGMREEAAPYGEDPMARRETLLLVRAYYGISEPPVRRRILDLMKSLGAENETVEN
ncbi:MAG: helix-turn-helix domain-containing protein [Alphaproteobacteria bacterium]